MTIVSVGYHIGLEVITNDSIPTMSLWKHIITKEPYNIIPVSKLSRHIIQCAHKSFTWSNNKRDACTNVVRKPRVILINTIHYLNINLSVKERLVHTNNIFWP